MHVYTAVLHGKTILSFSRIINKHTDESLGDCSFLNTCFHMDTCKYVHYEIDSPPEAEGSLLGPQAGSTELGLRAGDGDSNVGKLFPSQVRKEGMSKESENRGR